MKAIFLLGLWIAWAYFSIYAPYVQDAYEMNALTWILALIFAFGIGTWTDAYFGISCDDDL